MPNKRRRMMPSTTRCDASGDLDQNTLEMALFRIKTSASDLIAGWIQLPSA
jgi:hypothetical protein